MISRRILIAALGIGLSLEAAPAMAQAMEEIIITARKRDEAAHRVPVVASALTRETIERYQTNDLFAVANRVPGFVMGEAVGTVGIQTSLRGIGPTSQTATVDQSVSLNIDGLPLTQGHAFTAGMFDVAQIEVLKGPQALFFGKNSTAGVISLRSADPGDEFELIVKAGYESQAAEKVGELIVSGPVSDVLGLRLAVRYSDMDGFFRNFGEPLPGLGSLPPKNSNFAPKESWIVRGTAVFEPNDRYQARLKINYSDDRMEGNGGDGQVILCPEGTGGVPPIGIPFLHDNDCQLNKNFFLANYDPEFWPGIRNGGVPYLDSNQRFGSLEQDFEVAEDLTLSAVTGLYRIDRENLIQGSGTSISTIAADFDFENKQFTQEVRLTSDFTDSPINFMVGGFYQDAEMTVRNRLRGNTALGLPPLLMSGVHKVDIRSVSAFGQVLWQLTDQVEVAGGLRWTDEERKHAFQDVLAGRQVDVLVPKLSSDNISPEITLTYMPTDDLTLFAAYRRGFKSGSFNTVVSVDETTRSDFGDEEAEGGEIGLKSRLFGGALMLDLAAYHYKYSDLQVGANDVSPEGALVLRTLNAASAKVEGIELDATFNPPQLPNLTLRGAVNYNKSRYSRFNNAPCGNGQTIAEGCDQIFNPDTGLFTSQDLSGRPLVRAPDWTANFGFDYETEIGDGLTLAFGTTTRYSSKYFHNLIALPDYTQDGYFKTSANIALRGPNDGWELALIGNNLNNKLTTSMCSNANLRNGSIFGGQIAGGPEKGPAGSDELYCIPERGRELWLRFTWRL